jgi:hypothetical protein
MFSFSSGFAIGTVDGAGPEDFHFGILLHHYMLRACWILVSFRKEAYEGKAFGLRFDHYSPSVIVIRAKR